MEWKITSMSQIETYNLPNFPQSYNSVFPGKQHEQGHHDSYPVCVLERTTNFAQFQILLIKLRAPGTVQQ